MAYTTGTAANYKDLLAALVTFAAANGWAILEQSATAVFLKGSGLSGLDEIYVGIETFENPTSGIYNWNLTGAWGYRAGRAYNKMPHNSNAAGTDLVVGYFWNASMPYWMVADARRVILCAKVGTTYQMVHFGFLQVPGTDAQYPYPLFLGGAGRSNTINYTSASIGNFWSPYGNNYCKARLHTTSGAWGILDQTTPTHIRPTMVNMSLFAPDDGNTLTALDGTFLIEPIYLVGYQDAVIFGMIDGLFRVTGYNNNSENIITVDGTNYIVFQDGGRSTTTDFCCMRMS